MTVSVAEPHELILAPTVRALRDAGLEPVVPVIIDSSAHLHDEAALLNASELADAEAALIEDGIFSPRTWTEGELRAATKYGWAIAHAAQHSPVLWSVAGGRTATTSAELRFLTSEIRRRALPITHLALCWPVTLEPACDLGERTDAFLRTLADYATSTDLGLFIPHAAGKIPTLPIIATQLGSRALLDFSGLGWLEVARLLARSDGALFRRVLICAQEHFVFDKTGDLSTTEEDVRTLPDVPDHELERVFLDDPRGRQLLHVTARSIFAETALHEPLTAFLTAAAPKIAAALARQAESHATAFA